MMRLMSLLRPRQIGQPHASGSMRRHAALRGAGALILVNIGLVACEPTQSFEKTSDGSTIYLDQLSDAAKAEARQKIVENLSQGVAVYDLSVGDEVEIFFHVNRKTTARPYVISVADKLRIDFLGDLDNSRTVQVRPDGRISLPLIGSVMAAGQTANALAGQIQERYGKILTGSKISVNTTETHSPLDDFTKVLGSYTKGRSIVDKVLPDGTISLPRLDPIKAQGRTLNELKQDIDVAYSTKGLDVFVSLVPRNLRNNAAMVIGEVSKPGRIELERPTTVLMAVANAGGVLPGGAMNAVRLFYIGEDGAPRVRSINLNDVMDDFRLEHDMIVPNNSIIYVPPSDLTKAGRFMDEVLHNILRFQGFSLGGAYSIQ